MNMKKTVLSITELEKRLHCKVAVVTLCIMIFTTLCFLAISLLFAKGAFNIIMTILVMSIFLFFFGFNGLRSLIRTCKMWSKIKHKRFALLERQIVDIEMISCTDRDSNHNIYLNDGTMIQVTDGQGRKLCIGNMCYVLYLEGDDFPTQIFNTKEYMLDDELLTFLKRD